MSLTGILGLESLTVTPATASVVVTGDTPVDTAFVATGAFANGTSRDVTKEVLWRVDQSGRALADNDAKPGTITALPGGGGRVKVIATSGLIQGSATLDIKIVTSFVDPSVPVGSALPDGAGALFTAGTPDPSRNPTLVYPVDGVLLPPNLFGVEIHFLEGPKENTLFEVSFHSGFLDLRVFTRCQRPDGVSKGCIYSPDLPVWRALTNSNRGGLPVLVTVRGTDEEGTKVGASPPIKIAFSQDDLLGAVYYWTTKPEAAIMRWDFGDKKQVEPERVVTKSDTGGICPGCHAISRDGSKMIVSAGGQNKGDLLLFDLKKKQAIVPFPLKQRSQFESWSPDASAFVGMYGDGDVPGLLLFDGNSGAVKGTIDVGAMRPDHPDWSPDGKRIVFTNVGKHNTDQKSTRGEIAFVEKQGDAWGMPQVLVPRVSGKNHYYPAIGPQSDFLVYNQSTCPDGADDHGDCDFDMDPSSKLWGRYFAGADPAVELKNAGAPGPLDDKPDVINSYPKWSPFTFQLNEAQKLNWMTFTSRRSYGLRGSKILIWMVGVIPARLSAGEDPSFTAFALPFQDIASNNHIGQWTEKVVVIE